MAALESREKPVALQINNSGAWKTICRFDAADDIANMSVLDAANTLGNLDATPPTYRVVIDDGMAEVLMRWSKANGWKAVQR